MTNSECRTDRTSQFSVLQWRFGPAIILPCGMFFRGGAEERIRSARAKHNGFLRELGLPLLP